MPEVGEVRQANGETRKWNGSGWELTENHAAPGTYTGGFLKSVGDTTKETVGGIASRLNPINLLSDLLKLTPESLGHSAEAVYNGVMNPRLTAESIKNNVMDPRGGGEMIGDLLGMLATGRAPQLTALAKSKLGPSVARGAETAAAATKSPLGEAAMAGLRKTPIVGAPLGAAIDAYKATARPGKMAAGFEPNGMTTPPRQRVSRLTRPEYPETPPPAATAVDDLAPQNFQSSMADVDPHMPNRSGRPTGAEEFGDAADAFPSTEPAIDRYSPNVSGYEPNIHPAGFDPTPSTSELDELFPGTGSDTRFPDPIAAGKRQRHEEFWGLRDKPDLPPMSLGDESLSGLRGASDELTGELPSVMNESLPITTELGESGSGRLLPAMGETSETGKFAGRPTLMQLLQAKADELGTGKVTRVNQYPSASKMTDPGKSGSTVDKQLWQRGKIHDYYDKRNPARVLNTD